MEEHRAQSASPENPYDYRADNAGDAIEDDEALDSLRDCLATLGSPLPQWFAELRVPEMAEVVNQLSLVEAAEVVRRLPPDVAIVLCNFADLRRRAMICEQFAPELAGSILEGLSSDERTGNRARDEPSRTPSPSA
jgi:hypothetical protein